MRLCQGLRTVSRCRYDRLTVVETEHPLVQPPSDASSAPSSRIAEHAVGLIENGDTLQVGIGKLPGAILVALQNHRGLRLHGGMVTDGVMDLHAAGALRPGPDAMVCCTALGSRVYDWTAIR